MLNAFLEGVSSFGKFFFHARRVSSSSSVLKHTHNGDYLCLLCLWTVVSVVSFAKVLLPKMGIIIAAFKSIPEMGNENSRDTQVTATNEGE